MIPYFVIDKISLGNLNIYSWGLLGGLGFTAGYLLAFFRAKKAGFDETKIAWLALCVFLGAALGGRLLFLLQTPLRFLNEPSLFWTLGGGGAMFYGGLLGAIYAAWLFCKKTGWNFWKLGDLLAPSIALAIGIGRLGCALINDHAGSATALPWGIMWPDGVARHPVSVYESLLGFAIFAILMCYQKYLVMPNLVRHPGPETSSGRQNGSIFLLFLALYAAGRFLLDFFRESSGVLADPHFWVFSASQWISLMILVWSFFIARTGEAWFNGSNSNRS